MKNVCKSYCYYYHKFYIKALLYKTQYFRTVDIDKSLDNTHTECIVVFTLQQLLSATMLHYTYMACVV
jgi:hypothetical protein